MNKELPTLVDLVVNQRTFSFKKKIITFPYKDLINSGVLEVKQDSVGVSDSQEFTHLLYKHFASKFHFVLNSDFKITADFYSRVQKYFLANSKPVLGLTRQSRNLLKQLIKISNREFAVTFEEYSISLRKDIKDSILYDFNSAFSKCLPELEIQATQLYPTILHLYGQLKSDTYYNLDLADLLKGIQDYSRTHPLLGRILVDLLFSNKAKPVVDVYVAVLVGLYQSDRKGEYEKLVKLSKDETNQLAIVCAISAFNPVNNSEAKKLLLFLEDFNLKNNDITLNLARVYANFINNRAVTHKNTIQRCFKGLEELLRNEDILVKQAALREIQFISGHDDQVYNILNSLNISPVDDNIIPNISGIISRLTDPRYLFQFLRSYSENNFLSFEAKRFESSINKFRHEDPEKFSEYLIEFIIDDRGQLRHIGRRILSYLTIIGEKYRFEWDILNLSAIDQYKFLISLCRSNLEPKNIIPNIHPLRYSKFPFVVESYICKLEEMIEAYGSSVKVTLEEISNDEDDKDTQIKGVIESKIQEINLYINRKSEVREFNPFLTQSKLVDLFNEGFNEKFNWSLEESVQDSSSLLRFFPSVTLAKGGGWKLPDRNQISKLSTITTSFQFSRQFYISPEKIDFENRQDILENWSNAFDEWEAIISSLENI